MAAWCAAALVEVLFQSQAEGRLLEEPFLYLIFAILIAVELGAGTRGHNPVVEPPGEPIRRAATQREPVAVRATDGRPIPATARAVTTPESG